jgi:DNA-binding CsgD family transcriptional regulator
MRVKSSARLLLVVFDPAAKRVPSREVLQQVFRLTRAEAEVAVGILSGKKLTDIAVMRKVAVGTVRAHSKSVFLKTHTRGQADLTRLLGGLAFIVPELERAGDTFV